MCGCKRHQDGTSACSCDCTVHEGIPKVAGYGEPSMVGDDDLTVSKVRENLGASPARWGGGSEVGSPSPEALKIALTNWWIDLAHEEVDRVVPKAVEYGSTDLMEVGRTLAQTMGRHGLSDEEHTELGIFFYLAGKLARWTDAIKTGRRPSDDTLHDIGVYVRMAQRTRAVGGWPVGPDESP